MIAITGFSRVRETAGGLRDAVRNFKKSMAEPEEIDITPRANNKMDGAFDKGDKRD